MKKRLFPTAFLLGKPRRLCHPISVREELRAADKPTTAQDEQIRDARIVREFHASELAAANFLLYAQAAELEAARDAALASGRAKSAFLANISHEIRTPLNGILGMTELLLETCLSAEQEELARIAHESAKGLLSMIGDVLDFSKAEAGRMAPAEPEDFDLRTLLTEVVTLFGARARQKNLLLTCCVAPVVPLLLRGSPLHLRQIVGNLVSNAIKFTGAGMIQITADMWEDGTTGLRLLLTVRDTGIGIPTDRQQAVWESFTQADGSTTRRYGGSGLGLTICRQLADLMGGGITLQSLPGQGSTFCLSVPVGRADGENLPLWNEEFLLQTCGGDRELMVEAAEEWIRTTPRFLTDLVAASEPDAARRAAHALRGACRTVGVERLAALCAVLENVEAEALPALQERISVLWRQTQDGIPTTINNMAA